MLSKELWNLLFSQPKLVSNHNWRFKTLEGSTCQIGYETYGKLSEINELFVFVCAFSAF